MVWTRSHRSDVLRLIAYVESEVHPDISSESRISIVPLPPHPSYLQTTNKLLFLLFGPLKVLFQIACLWWALAYRTKPAKWLLVQVCFLARGGYLVGNNMLTVFSRFHRTLRRSQPSQLHPLCVSSDRRDSSLTGITLATLSLRSNWGTPIHWSSSPDGTSGRSADMLRPTYVLQPPWQRS